LSDTGVGDELTVVGQVTRGVARQGPVDESRNLEHDALPHRKPVQLAEHRRDMITSPVARHEVKLSRGISASFDGLMPFWSLALRE